MRKPATKASALGFYSHLLLRVGRFWEVTWLLLTLIILPRSLIGNKSTKSNTIILDSLRLRSYALLHTYLIHISGKSD